MDENWKAKLYSSYISTGQASRTVETNPTIGASDFIYFNARLRPLLPANLKCRILDLGCGNGGLIYVLYSAVRA